MGTWVRREISPTSQNMILTHGCRAPVMVTRLYTGPDGLTHSEQVTMKLGLNDIAATFVPLDELDRAFRAHIPWDGISQTP
jgi:hypothetical protein